MSRRRYVILFVPALLVLALTACKPVTTPSPAPVAEPGQQVEQASALRDTAWAMVSYGAENQIPVVPESYPSVNFMGDRYNGYTGCNFMLGVYIVTGSTIQVRWPSSTQGACDSEELFQQETGFMSALTAVEQYKIDGENLNLYVGDTQVMTMEPLEPLPFEGSTWNYKFLQTPQVTWQPVIPGTTITAVFEGDTVTGSAGCNDYTGTVTRDGNQMTISEVVATRKMCAEPEGIMEQEQQYLEKLQTTSLIREYARSFELHDTDKLPLMLFSAD